MHALADPERTHLALDSLLALEALRRREPGLEDVLSDVGAEFDNKSAPYIDALA